MEGRSGRRHTLVITKGPNRGKKVHFGGGKRIHGALRKTTKKGAYSKSAKKNFGKRRRPFVETKQQTDELVALKAGITTSTAVDTIRLTTQPLEISYGTISGSGTVDAQTLTIFPLYSYYNMNKGLDVSDMIGDTVFSRYLKCKVEFQLPFGTNQIKHPCDMYLIHGWITQTLGRTLHTNPDVLNTTRAQVIGHIQEQIQQYFNQRTDKLNYIPKRENQLKIEGYRKLKVKRNSNLGPDPNTISDGEHIFTGGSHPLVNMSCNWKMGRKTRYSQGKVVSATPTDLPHNYPNYNWLPFMALYNPTAAQFLDGLIYPGDDPGTVKPPKMYVRYNSVHYFTDS